MKDLMLKARKLAGNKYHICEEIKYENNEPKVEWKLYRKYWDCKVYFSEDNEEIMTSETNTMEELVEYLKKHHEIDPVKVWGQIAFVVSTIICIIAIANIYIGSASLRIFILTSLLFIIGGSIIRWEISDHNFKVFEEDLREFIKRDLIEDLKHIDNVTNEITTAMKKKRGRKPKNEEN